ncbi:MAG: ribosome silencing factor [Anaerolineae bacterium]|nr:ribosome silencing factor [Anaerolineae bacterium]
MTDVVIDKQGEDILILELKAVTTIADYFIICTGGSNRQLNALKSAIREDMKKACDGLIPLNVEGTPESGWILMDYGGVIVHLFSAQMRDFYRLSSLWENAKVIKRIQ